MNPSNIMDGTEHSLGGSMCLGGLSTPSDQTKKVSHSILVTVQLKHSSSY